jgi:hypothetical protein
VPEMIGTGDNRRPQDYAALRGEIDTRIAQAA